MPESEIPTCFIAMPVRTRQPEIDEFGDPDHWTHVMESLFIKAIRAAGYREVVPKAHGAWLIHDRIVTNLVEADMVLCDMSALNSNVFFELGVRTALNKPIALIYDGRSELSFDTSGINTYTYKVPPEYWSMDKHVAELAQHIAASADTCAGTNPLWRQFGLKITAERPTSSDTPLEAKLDLLLSSLPQVERLQAENDMLLNELEHRAASADFPSPYSPALDQERATKAAGLAAEAITRYGRREELALWARANPNGGVDLHVGLGIDKQHRSRVRELARRYGVIIRSESHEAPTPEQFLAGPYGTQDDDDRA